MQLDTERWKVTTREEVRTAFQKSAHQWLREGETPAFGGHFSTDPNHWIGLSLFKKALEGGEPVCLADWDGNLNVPVKGLLEGIIQGLGVRLIQERISDGGSNGSWIFSSEETMIAFRTHGAGRMASVGMASASKDICQKASQLFGRVIVPDNPDSGLVFYLVKSMSGFSISRLGAAGTALERGNYNPAVLSAYDHVVADLASPSPCGRLVILSGSPGTGKTYLVRSMLSTAKQCAFIVVPSHLVADLGGPEILPALTQAKAEFPGPICLILEDADRVLVNRNQGDMSSISAMLNLGDGILGAVLDIRILATTNAMKLDMDPATRRPGRLCRYIEVNELEPQIAEAAFQRLTGKQWKVQGPISIAEVYAKAREAGWVAPPIASPAPQMAKHIF